jgi:FAD dependent oxidoreductase
VMRVTVEGDASQALVVPVTGRTRDVSCDVVVIGAGMGGVSAALAATAGAHTVCMTEPTMWVGGQATSQGVSAFDDNKWIDTTGGTASYLELSRRIREYYAKSRRDTSIPIEQAIKGPLSNPGGCWVGRLCFEPEPAEEILMSMLQPSLKNERLKLWVHTVPVEVERKGRILRSVLAYDFGHNEWLRLHGKYFVEASELGELLPLSGLPFRIGAEAQSETHERNAPTNADPHASQSFTYPFILAKSLSSGATNDPKPPAYDSFLPHYTFVVDYGHGQLLTYGFYEHRKGLPGSFWVYRRSVDAELFRPEDFPTDRSMINWSSNDHCDANLLSNDPLLQAHALQDAKRASVGFAWWIRHSAPRDDHAGAGYPELEVMSHAMGSEDGLSQHPYIRESRRIIPIRTIVEEDLAVDFQPGARAALYPDTVGIGWYPIDIHSCDRQDFVSQSKPYEIPLGALIARDADNLLAVGKAIGTTHITNGAYRLHPTEWATGEAAGVTLAWSLDHKITPAKLDSDPKQLEKLQLALVRRGHPIFWYDDIPLDSPDFPEMQMAGARQWLKPDAATLHANSDSSLLGSEAATALRGIANASALDRIREKTELTWADLRSLGLDVGNRAGTVRRGDFATWMLNR